jgi:hypothetical protein
MRILIPILFAALVACGSSTPSTDGGGGGGNGGGGGGTGSGGDMSGGPSSSACSMPRDCRLFSSYCVSAPCRCFAIGANDVDPPCVGGMQSCLVDPCLNKTAACTNNSCTVSP